MSSPYHAVSIANLAAQLRRGPTRLRLKQLLGIEFLLSIIEDDKNYPLDFVIHALTGYRAPATTHEGGDAELFAGGSLREDLVALAEDLSESADMPVEAWHGAVYTLNDLAGRFRVSTKTIFRWRRRGLVGWKMRFPDRRMRVVFPDRCVRRFVAQNADLVQRGASFSQLSRSEREHIIARAQLLVSEGLKTANAVAKVLADETGRAVETIRLILKAYDDARPRAGIFNRSVLALEADDQRLEVWEAYVDGEAVEALSRRFKKPVSWVYRTITQMRARDLKSRPIEFVACDEFAQPGADVVILGDANALHPYAGPANPAKRIPADLPPYLRQLFFLPLLSPAGEQALFRKFNFLRWKAEQMRAALDPDTATAADLDRIDAVLSDANAVKNQIVQANLRLVVSIAKRHIAAGCDFFEVVSDGNVSLMRAVDKFDFSRGFKFSTYASWAIMKNYARTIPDQKFHLERYQTGRDELLETISGPLADEHESDQAVLLRNAVDRLLTTLESREQDILRERFGLNQREPQTLEQIGKRFGVSKERIRQIESRAIEKLRGDFGAEIRTLLGN